MVKRFVAELSRNDIVRGLGIIDPRRKVFSPTLFPINVAVASFIIRMTSPSQCLHRDRFGHRPSSVFCSFRIA